MGKDVKTAAFVTLDKYLDATDENVNKEQIVNAMIEYAELRLSKERGLAESLHESSGLNKPVVTGSASRNQLIQQLLTKLYEDSDNDERLEYHSKIACSYGIVTLDIKVE